MRLRRSAASLLAAASLSLVQAAERSTDTRTSFVERVWQSHFEKVENLFGENFSRESAVVVLRVNAGKPGSALALKRETSGDYTLTLAASIDGEIRNVTATVPGPVGDQVVRAVELKLHRHVMIGTVQRDYTKREGDIWLFHRNAQDRTSTGVILFETTIDNPDATVFIDGLIGGLQRLIGAEGADREAILAELDRIATRIVLSEGP